MKLKKIESLLRVVPNFPKPGIIFRDITPIFTKPKAIHSLSKKLVSINKSIGYDIIVGVESRGFLFGSIMADMTKSSFALARKEGKLPYDKISVSYGLEYGSSTIEMHTDSIKKYQRVLIHDDLLATGGTVLACAELVEKLGGIVVGFNFIIELNDLEGRERIQDKFPGIPITSVFNY